MFGWDRSKYDLLWEMTKAMFKIRYSGSVLGFLWVFLKPFLMFVIMYFVWTRFGGSEIDNYAMFLLTGLIMFNMVSDGFIQGMRSILESSEVILKINYPRQINVMTAMIMTIVNYLVSLLVLFIFGVFNPITPTWESLLYFLFISLILAICVYCVTLWLSVGYVWFRDLINITDLFLRLFLFATPILYSLDKLNPADQEIIGQLVLANPLGILINYARKAIIYGNIEGFELMLGYFIFSLIFLYISWKFFNRSIVTIAEHF